MYYDLINPLTSNAAEIRRCIITEDEIADDAFYQSPNVLLYCKKDSYAMNYAKRKNLFYVVKQ